jgi:hypothetical protein
MGSDLSSPGADDSPDLQELERNLDPGLINNRQDLHTVVDVRLL